MISSVYESIVKSPVFSLDRYLDLLKVIEDLSALYGANLSTLLQELAFQGETSVNELVLELTRVLLEKTDRTVIDLSDRKIRASRLLNRGEGHQKAYVYEELDSDLIEDYLLKILTFLTKITSTGMPYLLLPITV
jgi:hypothetical protein